MHVAAGRLRCDRSHLNRRCGSPTRKLPHEHLRQRGTREISCFHAAFGSSSGSRPRYCSRSHLRCLERSWRRLSLPSSCSTASRNSAYGTTPISTRNSRRASAVATLDEYLALEDRLFAQLQHEVYDKITDGRTHRFQSLQLWKQVRSRHLAAQLEPYLRSGKRHPGVRRASAAWLFRQPIQPTNCGTAVARRRG